MAFQMVSRAQHLALRAIPRCDQCEMLNINGVNCHETGCPNARKTWDSDRQDWVLYLKCRICGYDVEAGEYCRCCPETGEEPDEDEEPYCSDVRCGLPANHPGPCQSDDVDED